VFSVSFYKDLLTNFKSIYSGLSFIPAQLPIYLFSGDKDPVGNQGKNTKKLYHQLKKAKIIDVSLKLYPGGRHEMHNEKNKEEVYNDVINWLNEHLK
jgi:alpha-beta hydrolase superfamily lysophospholipase